MRGTRIGIAAASFLLALGLVACGGGGGSTPTTPALPTALPSLPTALPSLPTSLPSLPSGLPSLPGSGSLSSGSAHVDITGDVSTSFDLTTLESPSYIPGTVVGVSYTDQKGDTFSVGGLAPEGSTKTSPTLAVSFSAVQPTLIVGASVGGECTVNIDDESADHLSGTVTCQNLSTSGQNVNVNATFEASA